MKLGSIFAGAQLGDMPVELLGVACQGGLSRGGIGGGFGVEIRC